MWELNKKKKKKIGRDWSLTPALGLAWSRDLIPQSTTHVRWCCTRLSETVWDQTWLGLLNLVCTGARRHRPSLSPVCAGPQVQPRPPLAPNLRPNNRYRYSTVVSPHPTPHPPRGGQQWAKSTSVPTTLCEDFDCLFAIFVLSRLGGWARPAMLGTTEEVEVAEVEWTEERTGWHPPKFNETREPTVKFMRGRILLR